jgi:hypothetical protein
VIECLEKGCLEFWLGSVFSNNATLSLVYVYEINP